jgi:hypothetical protein
MSLMFALMMSETLEKKLTVDLLWTDEVSEPAVKKRGSQDQDQNQDQHEPRSRRDREKIGV